VNTQQLSIVTRAAADGFLETRGCEAGQEAGPAQNIRESVGRRLSAVQALDWPCQLVLGVSGFLIPVPQTAHGENGLAPGPGSLVGTVVHQLSQHLLHSVELSPPSAHTFSGLLGVGAFILQRVFLSPPSAAG
jgi:hypothetical protein